MKKILLATLLVVSIGFVNQTKAQCSGADAVITNFTVVPNINSVNYAFDWTFVQGNASLQVAFLCNNVEVGTLNCIQRIKDSTAGVHHVGGSFPIVCNGTIKVEVRIWTNPTCGGTNCAISREVTQATLPVTFKSFDAARNHSNVVLKWETATEVNNKGFVVERNINGSWEQVSFIPSQALNGMSTALLSYQYSDLNNTKGMTQYRIKQIDIDSKSKYTEVRAIRGEGQTGKTVVYPNPTNDGKVTIVFEDANVARNISVTDISGRTVKQLNNVSNNNITIDNLTPGMYSVRIVVPATGDQSVEKIVVNKR